MKKASNFSAIISIDLSSFTSWLTFYWIILIVSQIEWIWLLTVWPSKTFFMLGYYCLQRTIIFVTSVGISSIEPLPTTIKNCEMKLSLHSMIYDRGPLSVISNWAGIDPREWAYGDRRGHNIILLWKLRSVKRASNIRCRLLQEIMFNFIHR